MSLNATGSKERRRQREQDRRGGPHCSSHSSSVLGPRVAAQPTQPVASTLMALGPPDQPQGPILFQLLHNWTFPPWQNGLLAKAEKTNSHVSGKRDQILLGKSDSNAQL